MRKYLGLLCMIVVASSASAMLVNLARPYDPKPSKPRSPELSFYAQGRETFLFDLNVPVEVVCLPYQRVLDLEWSVAANRVAKPVLSGKALPGADGHVRIAPPVKELAPGFYDLSVKARISQDRYVTGTTTFGWRVNKMPVHAVRPKDFGEFWKKALARLDAVAPEPKVVLEKVLKGDEIGAYNAASAGLPEHYDEAGERFAEVEIYRVRFASYGGKTIEGWFTKPVGNGPFPCILVLPGAGNNARPAPVEHARHGYAALDIQVHGNPVDATEYAPLAREDTLNPEALAHYGIYLHAVQAARVLRTLPGVDAKRLAVMGGSQGGRLTMVVAALDPGVKAAVAGITHFAYMPWLMWTQQLNQEKKDGAGGFTAEAANAVMQGRPEPYFDVLNFAPMVRCPVMMNAGLIDPISPPTGIFAVFDALGSKRKELVPLPNLGHDWSPAFDRKAWPWLERELNR